MTSPAGFAVDQSFAQLTADGLSIIARYRTGSPWQRAANQNAVTPAVTAKTAAGGRPAQI